MLTCACLCSFENSLCLRSPFDCSSRLSLFPSVPNCGAMPSKAKGPPAERANIELLWLNACQLNQLAQDCGLNADTLLDIQRQKRLEFKVVVSRMTWGCWRHRTSHEEKAELLDAALRRCGLHPRAYAHGIHGPERRWRRVLQSYGIGWHFEYNEDAYTSTSGFWDNAGRAVDMFDFDLVDLEGLYYSDARLGAPVDWKAYLHFSSSLRDTCCDCYTRECEFCWEPHYLVEVASMAGCNAARMIRLLTLLKSGLSLDILTHIDSFLTTDI